MPYPRSRRHPRRTHRREHTHLHDARCSASRPANRHGRITRLRRRRPRRTAPDPGPTLCAPASTPVSDPRRARLYDLPASTPCRRRPPFLVTSSRAWETFVRQMVRRSCCPARGADYITSPGLVLHVPPERAANILALDEGDFRASLRAQFRQAASLSLPVVPRPAFRWRGGPRATGWPPPGGLGICLATR